MGDAWRLYRPLLWSPSRRCTSGCGHLRHAPALFSNSELHLRPDMGIWGIGARCFWYSVAQSLVLIFWYSVAQSLVLILWCAEGLRKRGVAEKSHLARRLAKYQTALKWAGHPYSMTLPWPQELTDRENPWTSASYI